MTVSTNELVTVKVDGIEGDVQYPEAKGSILAKGHHLRVSGPQHQPGSNNNGVTGKPYFDPYEVVVPANATSSQLFSKALIGDEIKSVAVTQWTIHNGKRVKVQVVTLTKATVAQFESKILPDGTLSEAVRFNCCEIKFESFKPDGAAAGSVTYDFVTGQKK